MKGKNILELLFLLMIILVNVDGNKDDLCKQVQPTKDIPDDCIKQGAEGGKICCYVTIKFKHNDFYECYPLEKKENIIKEQIKSFKTYYEGSKKVKIKCNSTFINFSFILLLSLSLLFFI